MRRKKRQMMRTKRIGMKRNLMDEMIYRSKLSELNLLERTTKEGRMTAMMRIRLVRMRVRRMMMRLTMRMKTTAMRKKNRKRRVEMVQRLRRKERRMREGRVCAALLPSFGMLRVGWILMETKRE